MRRTSSRSNAVPIAVAAVVGILAGSRSGSGLDGWRSGLAPALIVGVALPTLLTTVRTATYAVRTRRLHHVELYWKTRPPLLTPNLQLALVTLLYLAATAKDMGPTAFSLGAALAIATCIGASLVLRPIALRVVRRVNRPDGLREGWRRAAERHAGNSSLDELLVRAVAETAFGDQQEGLTLFRQALERPELAGVPRGVTAAHLAWGLVEVDREPPVPSEVRELAAIASTLAPRDPLTTALLAHLACLDGEFHDAEVASTRAMRSVLSEGTLAQLLCIRGVSRARQGRLGEARADREKAARTWPACDMLDWAARAIETRSG